ncbi:MAG TPA: Gfo/Idh/MocA family oxidoreductase [Geminicoccus sp.]|jgi:predicted dehydrogenase|uniref:Gfo/Idh/MocA family protein n=1 Tax=Geminicoccus sp. TaxID=2024832 RepID=UPI002E3104C5|nr:Gfo/Idh/MocA family oxidoreductase [Geminicoccus sp.]HEX2525956.1 Gfo/Idh/MocA family oxidoreductase [Geminicoccus sp.]
MSTFETRGILRVGFIGAGFIAHFHLKSLVGVRNVEVTAVYSPTPAKRQAFANAVAALELGTCTSHESLEALLSSGEVDAVWILSPNYTRLPTMQLIADAVRNGTSRVFAVACEKPLARTLHEAKEMLRLAEEAGLNHGYLENQLFSTAVIRGKEIIWRRAVPAAGRPYLARAAEEHSGPHEPWFWRGDQQGGGVLLDMMCHSVEVGRFLLTAPGAPRGSLVLKSATGTVATLKWARPRYVEDLKRRMGTEVDYARRPAEDFARGMLIFVDPDGHEVVVEATTSWAYVGAGLRIQLELLGPEYALEFSSLNTPLRIFMSRQVTGSEGEDLVEKQNAEQGLMPILEDEAGVYGYTDENRHMVECFRTGRPPMETFHDGVAVVEMLMALYKSAETQRTVNVADEDLTHYVPLVARPE